MDRDQFTAQAPGRLVASTGGAVAFVPDPLPPRLEISSDVLLALDSASNVQAYAPVG